jgi:hypothetical protein
VWQGVVAEEEQLEEQEGQGQEEELSSHQKHATQVCQERVLLALSIKNKCQERALLALSTTRAYLALPSPYRCCIFARCATRGST